jgi:glycosyltransferase involved in cell wall biosynthesis
MDTIMSEMKPNISVIVPVYNVGKYLYRCLDSIFDQKYSGTYEVIAVEDASTDNSLQLLRSYQNKEPGLRIIEHGVNRRLSVARATGIKASTGDYIMHVDSDDWLLPDALEKLFQKCLETDADIVVFNYVKDDNRGKRVSVKSIKKELITTNKLNVQYLFFGAVWNKIHKRSLAENMISGQVGVKSTEDLIYASEILLKSTKTCLIPEAYYVYFTNTESTSWATNPEQLLENQISVLQQIKAITAKYKAISKFTDNILSYLEKGIYFAISKSAFSAKREGIFNIGLINTFRLFPEMTDKRLNRLSLSMSNKYYSLVLVFLKFGPRPALGILLRSIRKLIIRKSKIR